MVLFSSTAFDTFAHLWFQHKLSLNCIKFKNKTKQNLMYLSDVLVLMCFIDSYSLARNTDSAIIRQSLVKDGWYVTI